MSQPVPSLITGGNHEDERGKLEFYNNFDMSCIKRIYFTTHLCTEVVRAWQAHKIENRWFCCTKGSFKVKLVKIDNFNNPSDILEVLEFSLSDKNQQILYIPSGYANGFKALQEDSKLMIMSNYMLNEIENDQVRFDENKWTTWTK